MAPETFPRAKVLLTRKEMELDAWADFFNMTDIDTRIEQRKYEPPNMDMNETISPQNTTSTIYTSIMSALTGQMTMQDVPVGEYTDINPRDLMTRIYKYAHSVNRGSIFSVRDFISWALANIDFAKFPAAHAQFGVPRSTVSSFDSGTNVCAGGKHISRVNLAAYLIRKLITTIPDPHTGEPKYIVPQMTCITQNRVVSMHVGFPLNNQALVHEHPLICSYSPEDFVAVVVDLTGRIDPISGQPINDATGLVFDTGNVIVSGVQKDHQIRAIMDYIRELVTPFRINQTVTEPKKRHLHRVVDELRAVKVGIRRKSAKKNTNNASGPTTIPRRRKNLTQKHELQTGEVEVVDMKGSAVPYVKPKRHRRTKAEMMALRGLL